MRIAYLADILKWRLFRVKKYLNVENSYFHQKKFQVPTSRNVVLHTISNYVQFQVEIHLATGFLLPQSSVHISFLWALTKANKYGPRSYLKAM